jgi:hypothetical protein
MAKAQRADCRECDWVIEFQPPVRQAPQLSGLLEGAENRVPRITDCEGARNFKVACGYEARWFVQKDKRK